MGNTDTIYSQCLNCGVTFRQPDDPGRRREYHSNACRQQAYRARGGRASGTHKPSPSAEQRRAEQESWAADQARRERERERSEQRRNARTGRAQEQIPTPEWTHATSTDSAAQAKYRRICNLLMRRAAHDSTNAHEAHQCQQKAQTIRTRYGL